MGRKLKEVLDSIDLLIEHFNGVNTVSTIKREEQARKENYFCANEAKVTAVMSSTFINCLKNIKEGNPLFYEEVELIIIDDEEDSELSNMHIT